MSDLIPMTEEGMRKLRNDMAELEKRRPEIKTAIEVAREKGDLRENADYHAAREELAMLNAKIAQINGMLANSVLIDPDKAPTDRIVMGHTVTFKRVTDGRELVRTLVGAGQENTAEGKILTTSPIGKALIGANIGDVVTAELPAGAQEFKIINFEF
jgi:transcription elongation factor GreA